MFLLGLAGKIGTGKTTVAHMLEHSGFFLRIAYGDALKEEVAETLSIPLEWCYSESGKKERISHPRLPQMGMTVRETLQWWGTEYRRTQDPEYWHRKIDAKITTITHRYPGKSIVIDDVRFIGEAEHIRSYVPHRIIRIHPYPGWKSGPHGYHRSEIELDNYTHFDEHAYPKYGMEELQRVANRFIDAVERRLWHKSKA